MPRRHNDALLLTEQTAPSTPASGTFAIYVKTDGHLYTKNDSGVEIDLTAGLLPIGSVTLSAASVIPTGWLVCDGAAVSRTTYAALYAALGGAASPWGLGDGSTTFNVPNAKGRVAVGRDSGDTDWDVLGETRGAKTHALSIAELASHDHGSVTGGQSATHTHSPGNGEAFPTTNGGVGGGAGSYMYSNTAQVANTSVASVGHNHPVTAQGSGTAHNNLQPSIVFNYIIRAL